MGALGGEGGSGYAMVGMMSAVVVVVEEAVVVGGGWCAALK